MGYFGVEGSGTLGMLDTLEESPVMTEEEGVEILNDFAQYLDEQIASPAVAEIKSAVEGLNPHKPKSISEMLGEYLREASVLILIFVPIELLIPKPDSPQKSIEPKWLFVTLALSLAMLGVGIWAERRK
jgi:hypothetical protein